MKLGKINYCRGEVSQKVCDVIKHSEVLFFQIGIS